MTTKISNVLRTTAPSIAPGRSYQHLSRHDRPRIAAFFLSFDFDQRRAYFGGGMSDRAILGFCSAIDWTTTDMIARSGRYCLEALATIVALSPDHTKAELAIACPLLCDQRRIIAELMSHVMELAATRYQSLVVRRELAHPDLIDELRQREFATCRGEEIEIDLDPPGKACLAREPIRLRA